jgi:BlaI family penicillinase repressor
MGDLPRISEAEWDVMRVVWERHPVTAATVAREVRSRRDWSVRTVKTLLSRLVRKGALDYEVDGKRYLYRPLVEREDCARAESRSFLDRVFGGAVRPALVHLVREADLSTEESTELLRLLDAEGEDSP